MRLKCNECCSKCGILCPLVIIGPGVRDHMNREENEKKGLEWFGDIEGSLDRLHKTHPEIFIVDNTAIDYDFVTITGKKIKSVVNSAINIDEDQRKIWRKEFIDIVNRRR